MALNANYITGKNGKIVSVILPIKKFRELIEVYGIDLSRDEIESIGRNKILRANRNNSLEKEYINIDAVGFRGDAYE